MTQMCHLRETPEMADYPPRRGAGLGANAPPMPSQGGKIGFCPPQYRQKWGKKGNFSRHRRRRENFFPKIPHFGDDLPPPIICPTCASAPSVCKSLRLHKFAVSGKSLRWQTPPHHLAHTGGGGGVGISMGGWTILQKMISGRFVG